MSDRPPFPELLCWAFYMRGGVQRVLIHGFREPLDRLVHIAWRAAASSLRAPILMMVVRATRLYTDRWASEFVEWKASVDVAGRARFEELAAQACLLLRVSGPAGRTAEERVLLAALEERVLRILLTTSSRIEGVLRDSHGTSIVAPVGASELQPTGGEASVSRVPLLRRGDGLTVEWGVRGKR